MAESSLRLDSLEQTSYDGTLVWRIPDFTRKKREAERGELQSVYSPVFYTARGGYRLRLRVYLHGDGAARGSYLSLFFVILRGEFDALLTWPFNSKVSHTTTIKYSNTTHAICSD